jgi:hypothetical protein
MTAYRHSMDDVTRSLSNAGLQVYATAMREPELEHESSAQAFVIARSPKLQESEQRDTQR